MSHRLRESWRTLAGVDGSYGLMAGPIEMDEVYIGGREKNKHVSRRDRIDKMSVIGMRDRMTGKVYARPIPEVTLARVGGFIDERAKLGATFYMDEGRHYMHLHKHHSVNHGDHEYGRGDIDINGMESFWALLKRGYHGTHHFMSHKYLHRYVTEFAGRLNLTKREDTPIGMIGHLARMMAGQRPTYKMLIA